MLTCVFLLFMMMFLDHSEGLAFVSMDYLLVEAFQTYEIK